MAMVYDLPQVSPTAQPMTPAAAPESHNYAPDQIRAASQATEQAANAIKEIQHNIDTAATKEADNKLSDAIRRALYDPENGYLAKPGKSAIDSRSDTIKAIQDAAQQMPQGLTNDVQKYMYKQASTARLQQAMQQIDAHAMQQTKVYHMGESEARIKGLSQDAIAALNVGDNKQYNDRKQAMLIESDEYARLAGFSPDQKKQYRLAATSALSTNIIDGMINNGKAKEAQQYYKDNKDDINPDLYDNLDKKVGDAVAYVDGNDMGSDLFTKYAPKNKNESIKTATAKMLADIDKSGKDKNVKDYARKAVKDLADQYSMAKTGAAEDAGDNLYGYMNSKGATYSGSINMVNQWENADKIDHKDAEALRDAADRKFRISEGRAEAKQAQDLKYLSNFLKLQNDYAAGLIPRMEPKQAAKYISVLGPFADNFMQFVNHSNNSAYDVKLSMDKLKEELRVMKQNPAFKELKTIPNPDSNGEEDKASLALLNQKVIARIAASGTAGPGKQMTVQQALSEELKPVVTGKGIFWDDETPRYKLGTTAADNPKQWTKEAKTAFINDSFYRKNGRYPTPYEATVFMHQLDK